LVEVLVLSQIPNIKLPSCVVLRRKEVKKIHLKCTGVNIGLLTFCTDSTYFLLEYVSVVAVNCDPRTLTVSVLSSLGWLSIIYNIQ
jgi:hypothetical protein